MAFTTKIRSFRASSLPTATAWNSEQMQTTYICSEEDLLASGYALVLFEDSKCGKEFLAQKKADRELAERRANSTPSKSSDGYGSGWGSDEGFWHG
jgi:hypothetical protein